MATQEQSKVFNPSDHLQRIQGKDYLPVRWRLVWFRQETGTKAGYITVELEYNRQAGFAKYFTIAWDGADDTWRHIQINGIELDVCGRVATGEGSETQTDFFDYAEKAATKSVGRAMAGLGFGTQFAPELDEKHRVVDSPTERSGRSTASSPARNGGGASASAQPRPVVAAQRDAEADGAGHEQSEDQPANEQQMMSIRKLCAALGREEPDPKVLTFTGASALIRQLSRDYNAARRAS